MSQRAPAKPATAPNLALLQKARHGQRLVLIILCRLAGQEQISAVLLDCARELTVLIFAIYNQADLRSQRPVFAASRTCCTHGALMSSMRQCRVLAATK